MKKGFTLAEVLITLAIIGVVAALTIPTLVHKYQQKQLYTAFMKMYNSLSAAYHLSTADNGEASGWSQGALTDKEFLQKYMGDYLKVAKDCTGDASACSISSDMKIKPLNYDGEIEGLEYYADLFTMAQASYLLQDGSFVIGILNGDRIMFFTDTNGAKGPNVMGRDIFSFNVDSRGLHPYDDGGDSLTLEQLTTTESEDENCSTTVPSYGQYCGTRLLLEGAMKY